MSDPESLNGIVSESVLQRQAELRERFAEASPFRHVAIDDFFATAFCAELNASFPAFDVKRAINENGEVGGKSTQERVRQLGLTWQRLDDVVQGAEFLSLVGTITGIDNLHYDPYYFGGGTHENRQGQDLDPHVDFNYHPITRQHRRLNLIVYLNEEWQDAWGGSLQLHRDPYRVPAEDEIVTLTPLMNRCVIFETNEHSWHGFERISLPADRQHLSRRSFALYYYTDSRPAEECASEHSTIYVERHLPARYQPGLVLAEADLQEMRVLLARRDQHLKRLYGYIRNLNDEVNGLRAARFVDPPDAGGVMSVPAQTGIVDEQVRHLRARVRELEQSTSWRVTAPLRTLRRLLG